MALKDTIKKMEGMLMDLAMDLRKASEKGNRAAAQRVRTGTIKFAKLSKQFRKESVAAGKKTGGKKKKAKKTVRKKAVKKKVTRKKAVKKKAPARKKKATRRKRR